MAVTTSLRVENPATGEEIARVPIDSEGDVAAAVARIRDAQPEWAALGFAGRRRWLNRLRDWMLDNSAEIADTLKAETGKVRAEATIEVPYLADLINFYGARAGKMLKERRVRPSSPLTATRRLRLRYEPFPVVGLISPWNFPLVLSLGDAIPALMAGAAVVMKPSEVTPLGLNEIVTAWREEIGGPDVLAVVNGAAETATALIDHSDFVGFTGSDVTGRKVMARAAETLTPVSLELGGKDPMVVLEGGNLDRAANAAAWGGMLNSGQMCISVERIYVEDGAYDAFIDRLTGEVEALTQGTDGAVAACDVGAMTMESQLEKVERQVDEAVAAGARVLTGGRRSEGPGRYFEPTVLVDVTPEMSVASDETFGPVVTVTRVRDEDEAVFRANDSRYGLSASVFGPRGRAERVARRLEAGAVNVNDMIFNMLAPGLPMGGWKESGLGYRNGEYGIRKYCRSQAVVSARLLGRSELLWYPYTARRHQQTMGLLRLVNSRGLRRFRS
ncbi:MAG: aldehyde dehydrogenase family protein [Solirubrobacterales bacterium]|nr:aldehyde dehydrogenase family protein [Solirubrobacterales bacterium]